MSAYKMIGVVGGGTMGSGIAYEIARNLDAAVVVREVSPEAAERAEINIAKLIARPVQKGQVSEEVAEGWHNKIKVTTEFQDLAQADLVVEAVFEDLELKKDTFKALSAVCAESTILASNTSGLPITQMAAVVKRPERVVGMHFFNPVPAMKLVELVRAYQTSEETLQKAKEFCQSLQKETVVAKDYPGFITTRIGLMMVAEGIRCLEEGIGTAEDIDKAMKLAFNFPMGPLELADLVGLDVQLHVQETQERELGERFKPSPLLRQMVAAGYLGRKAGRGFYTYEK